MASAWTARPNSSGGVWVGASTQNFCKICRRPEHSERRHRPKQHRYPRVIAHRAQITARLSARASVCAETSISRSTTRPPVPRAFLKLCGGLYHACTMHVPPMYLAFTSQSPPKHLACTSHVPPMYLACTWLWAALPAFAVLPAACSVSGFNRIPRAGTPGFFNSKITSPDTSRGWPSQPNPLGRVGQLRPGGRRGTLTPARRS